MRSFRPKLCLANRIKSETGRSLKHGISLQYVRDITSRLVPWEVRIPPERLLAVIQSRRPVAAPGAPPTVVCGSTASCLPGSRRNAANEHASWSVHRGQVNRIKKIDRNIPTLLRQPHLRASRSWNKPDPLGDRSSVRRCRRKGLSSGPKV